MKIKEGFILREVSGTYIVVAVGNMVKNFNGMINLNETGAFLWKQLEKGCSQEQLVQALLGEYDVAKDVAENHVDKFVKHLTEANLLV